jgi:hypothetical protein
MSDAQNSAEARVLATFRELVGERASRLEFGPPSEAAAKIAEALASDYPSNVASDIAFHLGDWRSDAAFLVALHLFPDRFAAEEVKAGVVNLLIHAPNHLAAAAKLAGYPIENVFGV